MFCTCKVAHGVQGILLVHLCVMGHTGLFLGVCILANNRRQHLITYTQEHKAKGVASLSIGITVGLRGDDQTPLHMCTWQLGRAYLHVHGNARQSGHFLCPYESNHGTKGTCLCISTILWKAERGTSFGSATSPSRHSAFAHWHRNREVCIPTHGSTWDRVASYTPRPLSVRGIFATWTSP